MTTTRTGTQALLETGDTGTKASASEQASGRPDVLRRGDAETS